MNQHKRVAVVLSGCGHKDGTEITEAVSVLIALSEAGAQYRIFAPNMEFTVTNAIAIAIATPANPQPANETRNVLQESARIARGEIQDLQELKAKDFDALVFPGGFGAALNLSSWAKQGAAGQVHAEVERVILQFFNEQKPIGAICIAPTLIARVLGAKGITLTIGNDASTAAEIAKTGAIHEDCAVTDFVTDREHRVITTPAYMFDDATPYQVFTGVRKAMRELVEMA